MEETTNKAEEQTQKTPKLSYEELEAYAAQTTTQAKRILKENQMLKTALYEANLKEIELALKCLEHTDKFSPTFIKSIVVRIEELLNPDINKAEKESENVDKTDKTDKEEE